MSEELSVEFGNIGVDDQYSEADSHEEREQADRDRELNGLLSQAFDDLSSVTDEDEDRTSEDVARDADQPSPAPHFDSVYHDSDTEHTEKMEEAIHNVQARLDQNSILQQKLEESQSEISALRLQIKQLESCPGSDGRDSDPNKFLQKQVHELKTYVHALERKAQKSVDKEAELEDLRVKNLSLADALKNAELKNDDLQTEMQVMRVMHEKTKNDFASNKRPNGTEIFREIAVNNTEMQTLKSELEKALQNLQTRRNQTSVLQSQVEESRAEINNLQSRIRTLETYSQNSMSIADHETEVNVLKKQLHDFKNFATELKAKANRADDIEFEFNELKIKSSHFTEAFENAERQNSELRTEVRNLQDSLKKAKSSAVVSRENLMSVDNVKEMVMITTQLYKQEVQENFKAHMEDELRKANEKFNTSKLEIVTAAKQEWNEELNKQIYMFTVWLRSFFSTTVQPPENEIQALLYPIQKLWIAFQTSTNDLMRNLEERRQELRVAKEELDEALNDSRANGGDLSSADSGIFRAYKEELENVNKQMREMKAKLSKYKRKYYQTLKDHEEEKESLKQEFADKLRYRT